MWDSAERRLPPRRRCWSPRTSAPATSWPRRTWTPARTPRPRPSWSGSCAPTRARSTPACSSGFLLRPGQALRRGDRGPARGRQHRAQAARALPLPRHRVLPGQGVRPRGRDAAGRAHPRRQAEGSALPARRRATRSRQKFDDAVQPFRHVITLDPKHAEAYNYVGYMYAERGQNLDEAVPADRQGARRSSRTTATSSTASAGPTTSRAATRRRCASSSAPSTKAKEDPVIFEHLGDALHQERPRRGRRSPPGRRRCSSIPPPTA